MKIRYLKRKDIDTAKWDNCIARSVNGIVYAFSWYLDIMAKRWDALIGDDYRAVFPLTYNTKYGIRYVYQPSFTQQLGLFSTTRANNALLSAFLDAIPKHFRLIDIKLNTHLNVDYPPANIITRVTYHLDLTEPYDLLSSRYSKNHRRNLSKAAASGITVVKGISTQELLELKKNNMVVPLRRKHLDILNKLINSSIDNGTGELYGVYTAENKLCAGALFLCSNAKAIYLLASISDEGRNTRAMFALLDNYIKSNSGSDIILDFEGSNIESVARFYAGFGASPCEYSHIVINRLPWFIKLFR